MKKVYLDLTAWTDINEYYPTENESIEVGYIDWVMKDGIYHQILNVYAGHWETDEQNNKCWILSSKDLAEQRKFQRTPQVWKRITKEEMNEYRYKN